MSMCRSLAIWMAGSSSGHDGKEREPSSRAQQLTGDDDLLDVAGALIDLAHPHVTIDTLDQEVLEESVAAVNLDRVGAHLLRHLAREQLGHRRVLERPGAAGAHGAGVL